MSKPENLNIYSLEEVTGLMTTDNGILLRRRSWGQINSGIRKMMIIKVSARP